MQTFAQSNFGLFGEQRLALEPALLAVILAGGVGAFIHYELPNGARMSQLPSWSAVTEPERKELAPASAVTPALQIPVSFGTKAAQIGVLQGRTAERSGEPEVATATLLDKPPATDRSFLSRLNGSASKQDYVIRLTFPEPAVSALAVAAKPSAPVSGLVVRDAVPLPDTGLTTVSIDLARGGFDPENGRFVADGAAALDPEAVVGIQAARLAELQAASTAEPQGFTGLAVLPLDSSGFDLAMLPKNASVAAEPRTAMANPNRKAGTNLAAKASAASRAGLKPASTQDRIVGEFIFHRTAVQLNDNPAGKLDVRIGGDASLSIQVSALLSIVEGQMDSSVFAAMSASAGATEFVSFSEIRAAGIDVRYDAAADQIVLTAD